MPSEHGPVASEVGAPSDPPPVGARRLHPASVLLGVDVRRAARALVPPIVLAAGALGTGQTVVATLAIGILALAWRVLAWRRFRYAFDGRVVRIDEGVLQRRRRSLDVGRIQQVELDRSLLQRLLGVAVVRLETASDAGETEVLLRVVDEDEARRLRAAVRAARDQREQVAGPSPQRQAVPVLQVPLRHVALAAVTGSRLLVVPALLLGALEWADDLGGGASLLSLARGAAGGAIVPLVAGALLLTLAAAAVVGVLRDGEFTVEQLGDDLLVRRGLLSTREATLPLARLQMVAVERSWVRRWLRVAAVQLHSAGGTAGDAERRIVVPLLPESAVDALVARLLPGVPRRPSLVRHPRAARRRLTWRWARALAVPVVAVTVLTWPAGLWSALVVPPMAIALSRAEHALLGHALTPAVAVARSGLVSAVTRYVPRRKIQGVSRTSSPFQRRLALASVQVHVAGPGRRLTIHDAGADTAAGLWDGLRLPGAGPTGAGPV